MHNPRDDSWLQEVFATNRKTLQRVLCRCGLCKPDVDEILYRTLEIALTKRLQIGPGREGAFLRAVAMHLASTCRRTQNRRREVLDSTLLSNVSDQHLSPELLIDAHRACAAILKIGATLPLRQRDVFRLVVIEGYTTGEVSSMLGLGILTVKSNLGRAWDSFRKRARTHPARGVLEEFGAELSRRSGEESRRPATAPKRAQEQALPNQTDQSQELASGPQHALVSDKHIAA